MNLESDQCSALSGVGRILVLSAFLNELVVYAPEYYDGAEGVFVVRCDGPGRVRLEGKGI